MNTQHLIIKKAIGTNTTIGALAWGSKCIGQCTPDLLACASWERLTEGILR